MALYRSLRTLTSRNSKNKVSRTFLTFLLSSPIPFPSPSPSPFLSPRSRFLSPLSKWIIPFRGGPLFLSSPPWKLSQAATPVYFQSDVVVLPTVKTLNFQRFPNLGLASVPSLLSRTVVKEFDAAEVSFGGGGGGFAESIVNLPNLISISRLVSGPFLGWMILQEMYLPAFVGLVISGATDWLDGYVARKMGITSVIGSYLDPLADKVLIGCVALAMVEKGLLHPGLVGLIVLRDLVLIWGAVYKRASGMDWERKSWSDFFDIDGTYPEKVEPLFLSKVNTVLQLVLVAAALLQPEFGAPETQAYITYLSWLVASTTVASTAAYGVQHLRRKSLMIKRNSS